MHKFTNSQVSKHLLSLRKSTLKNQPMDDPRVRNLIGSPEEIIARVERYRQAGCDTLSALIFAGSTEQEVLDDMAYFAETVMPHFA